MHVAAYIGLGSNLGDRLTALAAALEALDRLPATSLVAVSQAYETEPWGVADQPRYANAVARIDTGLAADQLLGALNDIEDALGRVRGERYGARTIDLDILLFGDEEWDAPDLVIPHPRMAERAFVVRPLLEIAPDVRLPDGSALDPGAAREGRIVAALGPVPGFEHLTVAPGEPVAVSDADADPFQPTEYALRPGETWVAVAEQQRRPLLGYGPDLELLFLETVLREEGIPRALGPEAPDQQHNPWGLRGLLRLFVPSSFESRARRLIEDALRARPEQGWEDSAGE